MLPRLRTLFQAARSRLTAVVAAIADDPYYGIADPYTDDLAGLRATRQAHPMTSGLDADHDRIMAGIAPVEPVALTVGQRDAFEAVTGGATNIALVSSVIFGEPVAVIAAVTDEPDGGVLITPLYVECTDEVFGRLTDPAMGFA